MNRSPNSTALLLIIAYIGFISLGLPDTLIGVAWPSVRDHFKVQQSAIALIFFGGGLSYFFSSFFTGRLLKYFSVGSLLAVSSGLVALSGFGYGTAPLWGLFAACSLLHGLGSGAIDAGLNHYVAHHFSARHMNWLHAFYSLGAMLGPLIMTSVIAWSGAWRAGYLTVAGILLSLSLLFAMTRRRWNEPGTQEQEEESENSSVSTGQTLRHPMVWLHIVLFFIYTGLEVTVGQWSFTILTESREVKKETAGIWVTIYWASLFLGRILFGFVVERVGIDRVIRLSIGMAVAGTALFVFGRSQALSAVALSLIGFGLAAIYPCLMTRTPQRIGKALAAHAIGFQVSAAMVGAAALPSLCGVLAQSRGPEAAAVGGVCMALALFLVHEMVLFRSKKQAFQNK